jgi:hypothetical protein
MLLLFGRAGTLGENNDILRVEHAGRRAVVLLVMATESWWWSKEWPLGDAATPLRPGTYTRQANWTKGLLVVRRTLLARPEIMLVFFSRWRFLFSADEANCNNGELSCR